MITQELARHITRQQDGWNAAIGLVVSEDVHSVVGKPLRLLLVPMKTSARTAATASSLQSIPNNNLPPSRLIQEPKRSLGVRDWSRRRSAPWRVHRRSEKVRWGIVRNVIARGVIVREVTVRGMIVG